MQGTNRRLLKVKFGSDKKHVFVYEVIKDKDNEIIDEFDFKSKDKALPEFYAKLQAMGEHACGIVEFPREYRDNVTVIGVSFSYTEVDGREEDVMGAVITFRKELRGSNSPLIVNTPFKPSEHYNTDENGESPLDPALLLTEECVQALKELEIEAFRYIDGEREGQLSMFEGKGKEATPPSSPLPEGEGEQKPDDDDYQGDAFKAVSTKKRPSKQFRRFDHDPPENVYPA